MSCDMPIINVKEASAHYRDLFYANICKSHTTEKINEVHLMSNKSHHSLTFFFSRWLEYPPFVVYPPFKCSPPVPFEPGNCPQLTPSLWFGGVCNSRPQILDGREPFLRHGTHRLQPDRRRGTKGQDWTLAGVPILIPLRWSGFRHKGLVNAESYLEMFKIAMWPVVRRMLTWQDTCFQLVVPVSEKICPRPSDVRETRQISVLKLPKIGVCQKLSEY